MRSENTHICHEINMQFSLLNMTGLLRHFCDVTNVVANFQTIGKKILKFRSPRMSCYSLVTSGVIIEFAQNAIPLDSSSAAFQSKWLRSVVFKISFF